MTEVAVPGWANFGRGRETGRTAASTRRGRTKPGCIERWESYNTVGGGASIDSVNTPETLLNSGPSGGQINFTQGSDLEASLGFWSPAFSSNWLGPVNANTDVRPSISEVMKQNGPVQIQRVGWATPFACVMTGNMCIRRKRRLFEEMLKGADEAVHNVDQVAEISSCRMGVIQGGEDDPNSIQLTGCSLHHGRFSVRERVYVFGLLFELVRPAIQKKANAPKPPIHFVNIPYQTQHIQIDCSLPVWRLPGGRA
ncbi:hypothetical protein B0H13DRAFT_1874188 [Mycena leptocephala]|nr:hypothetical protein B0H13DRAFT_1874188 [Mycena leptocephala]